VIVGKDEQLIEQILRVLTYFIRCSELTENTEECPLLTVDVDDTTTLMSTSDTPTPNSCLTADVTLSYSAVSTSAKTPSPAIGETRQLTACDSNPTFVLKSPPSSVGRGIHVRFQNGDSGASHCSVETTELEVRTVQSTTVSSCSVATTSVMADQPLQLKTDGQLVPEPLLCFRSDVSDTLPPLLGETCSGCNYIEPCEDCSINLKNSNLKVVTERNDENVSVGSCKPSYCSVSDTLSDRNSCSEIFPPSDSPRLCHLSPVEANERVRVERVVHVGRALVENRRPELHHVPLEKRVVSSDSRHSSTKLPTSKEHSPVRQVPQYQHGNSMFDEYFDGSAVIDLCTGTDSKSTFRFGVDDSSTFDEIMNEPCPDVSHIDVSRLSSSSSSSEVVPELPSDNTVPPSDSTVRQNSTVPEVVSNPVRSGSSSSSSPATFDNVFDEGHFAVSSSDEHLNDIPDGPSKQMISSAIKLMQDVCLDHTSQSSVDDLADVPASDYFSQTGLAPSRGRQRHPSGQSNSSVHCR